MQISADSWSGKQQHRWSCAETSRLARASIQLCNDDSITTSVSISETYRLLSQPEHQHCNATLNLLVFRWLVQVVGTTQRRLTECPMCDGVSLSQQQQLARCVVLPAGECVHYPLGGALNWIAWVGFLLTKSRKQWKTDNDNLICHNALSADWNHVSRQIASASVLWVYKNNQDIRDVPGAFVRDTIVDWIIAIHANNIWQCIGGTIFIVKSE